MDCPDKEIIEGCIRKEYKYQKLLYNKYADILFGVCIRNSKNKEDAMDIFQEAFIKLYSNIEKYSYLGSFEGWLKKFFIRCAWNYYRGKKNNIYNIEIQEEYFGNEENYALLKFTDDKLLEALDKLTDRERIVLNMHEIEGINIDEVAEITGLTKTNAKTINTRAKQKVIKYLYQE